MGCAAHAVTAQPATRQQQDTAQNGTSPLYRLGRQAGLQDLGRHLLRRKLHLLTKLLNTGPGLFVQGVGRQPDLEVPLLVLLHFTGPKDDLPLQGLGIDRIQGGARRAHGRALASRSAITAKQACVACSMYLRTVATAIP